MAVWTGIALGAAWFTFSCGSRGFFPFDQSIVFDGGYRVLLGQVPYKDFLAPVGPLPFLLQALFFRLFGVSYTAYLLHAALANALAALLAAGCVRILFRNSRIASALCGLITAAWFYPPFGTPWLEQTAFLFHLAVVVLLSFGLTRNSPGPLRVLLFASGILSSFAFLSKQNVGLLSMASVLTLLLLGPMRWRRTFWFLAGMAACGLVFGLWLWACSDPAQFLQAFWVVPSAEGLRRFADPEFQGVLLSQFLPRSVTPAVSLAVLVASAAGVLLAGRRPSANQGSVERARLGFMLAASLSILQVAFIGFTYNAPENGYAFCGLAAVLTVLSLGQVVRASRPLSPMPSWPEAIMVVLIATPLIQAGWEVSRSRMVQDFWWPIQFRNPEFSVALAPARWGVRRGEPDSQRALRASDLDALARFLAENGKSFFVFPDTTVLYGIVGIRPPQPLLWFHRGLTYSTASAPGLDRRIVAELEARAVRHVVFETVALRGAERTLRDFPLLRDYIANRFAPIRRFGIFEVRERLAAGANAGEAR